MVVFLYVLLYLLIGILVMRLPTTILEKLNKDAADDVNAVGHDILCNELDESHKVKSVCNLILITVLPIIVWPVLLPFEITGLVIMLKKN